MIGKTFHWSVEERLTTLVLRVHPWNVIFTSETWIGKTCSEIGGKTAARQLTNQFWGVRFCGPEGKNQCHSGEIKKVVCLQRTLAVQSSSTKIDVFGSSLVWIILNLFLCATKLARGQLACSILCLVANGSSQLSTCFSVQWNLDIPSVWLAANPINAHSLPCCKRILSAQRAPPSFYKSFSAASWTRSKPGWKFQIGPNMKTLGQALALLIHWFKLSSYSWLVGIILHPPLEQKGREIGCTASIEYPNQNVVKLRCWCFIILTQGNTSMNEDSPCASNRKDDVWGIRT